MERSPNKKQSLLFFHLYPHIPGFIECWADSIIPCAFCDGYENRGETTVGHTNSPLQ